MKTTTKINPKWNDYDKALAQCHLLNWEEIYLDEYGMPMEIEDVIYMKERD